jgi:hypothetical protein
MDFSVIHQAGSGYTNDSFFHTELTSQPEIQHHQPRFERGRPQIKEGENQTLQKPEPRFSEPVLRCRTFNLRLCPWRSLGDSE